MKTGQILPVAIGLLELDATLGVGWDNELEDAILQLENEQRQYREYMKDNA
jgi:hypothetical protein